MNQTDLQDANRRAAWIWGSLIVGLLGLQVAGGIFAIILATGDKTVAIVPDYHQKSLLWDDEMAAKRASDELGWQCVIVPLPTSNGRAVAGLTATLHDGQGQVVQAKQGSLRWYRHTRANEVRELPLPRGPLTAMRLDDCFDASGLWEIMIEVTDLNGNRFLHSETLNIPATRATETN